jgi:hypothetical protein
MHLFCQRDFARQMPRKQDLCNFDCVQVRKALACRQTIRHSGIKQE